MDSTTTYNQCLANPGLAISAGASALVKWANTFSMKINGIITGSVTTANAPSLATAMLQNVNPTSPTNPTNNVVSLPADTGATNTGINSCQAFTLIATIPSGASNNPTPTYSWLAGAPFSKYTANMEANIPNRTANNQCEVGYVIVQNASAAVFVPGTTALDTSGLTVTYINNYAIYGE